MGLTAEERQKLTAFEAMIKKNNWLEGIDLNNTEAVFQRLKDRFAALDELGHSGELYKEYIALRRKEKEPDVKKAPKSNSASSAAKDIKKPDIKDVKENKNGPVLVKPLRKVKKTLDPNNDDGLKILAQKEDDLKFASEQLKALNQRIVNPQDVLTNWDHYADFLGKEEAEDTSKKAAPKITEFTNAPTYYAFENVFSQLKYEFFDRKIEEAENVYGVESDFSDDLKGFNHINEDTLNEEALRRADEFLAADARDMAPDEERKLLLTGIELLCHSAFHSENVDEPERIIRNRIFNKIRTITKNRTEALDALIVSERSIGGAYDFIYGKGGQTAVDYFQWVTSLGASLENFLSQNRLDISLDKIEAGIKNRDRLDNFIDSRLDKNYVFEKPQYDILLKKVESLEKETKELEEYCTSFKEEYDELKEKWKNEKESQGILIARLRKEYTQVINEHSHLEEEDAVLEETLKAKEKELKELENATKAEEAAVREKVEQFDWNEHIKRIANTLTATENKSYEEEIVRINEWAAEKGLNIKYAPEDADKYKDLVQKQKDLDKIRDELDKLLKSRANYEVDSHTYFEGRGSISMDYHGIDEEKLYTFATKANDILQNDHIILDSIIKVNQANSAKDSSNLPDVLENCKNSCKAAVEALKKAYDIKELCDDTFKKTFKAYRDDRLKDNKNTEIAELRLSYSGSNTVKNALKSLMAAKTADEFTDAANDLLNGSIKYRNQLRVAYSVQYKTVKAEADTLYNMINPKPEDMAQALKNASRNLADKKKVYDNLAIKEGSEEYNKAKKEYEDASVLNKYASAYDSLKAIDAIFENASEGNGRLNYYLNNIGSLLTDTNDLESKYGELQKDYNTLKNDCKKQMIEDAQQKYLEHMRAVPINVRNQVQKEFVNEVNKNIKKYDDGNTLGAQITDLGKEINQLRTQRKDKAKELSIKLDLYNKLKAEIGEKSQTLEDCKLFYNKTINEYENKLADYKLTKHKLANMTGIVKHEIPKMCEYFKNAVKDYDDVCKEAGVTAKDRENLLQKNHVNLGRLGSAGPVKQFRESTFKQLSQYYEASKLGSRWLKSSNSDAFTKMVNAVGETIGYDKVDNSGKVVATENKINTLFSGTLEESLDKLIAIRDAAAEYLKAKKNQESIFRVTASDLRIRRLGYAMNLKRFAEASINALVGSPENENDVVNAAENPKNNPAVPNESESSSVKKPKLYSSGLICKFNEMNKKFNMFIQPVRADNSNIFEKYKEESLKAKHFTSENKTSGIFSDNPETQAFMNVYLNKIVYDRNKDNTLPNESMHFYMSDKKVKKMPAQAAKNENAAASNDPNLSKNGKKVINLELKKDDEITLSFNK